MRLMAFTCGIIAQVSVCGMRNWWRSSVSHHHALVRAPWRRYIYHSLYCFFDRDVVGLPGLAEYFRRSSEEEREHAEKLMAQQARPG